MKRLMEICTVDWGDTSLTKSAYIENGKYLGVSAAGCDGRMDYYDFDAFTPVISAIGANCGKLFLPDEPFVAIKNTITLKPKGELSGKYLYYALFNNRIPKRGGGQPFISKGDTEQYEIPLPDNKKQKYIVETLDKTLEIIKNRQKQLNTFDDLIKARFVEMFGNETNPYDWPAITVEEVANVTVRGQLLPYLSQAWALNTPYGAGSGRNTYDRSRTLRSADFRVQPALIK